MTKLWAVAIAVFVAGCAEEEVPSCQQAIGTFYGGGCYFADITTNPPTPTTQNQALASCQQININVPDRCQEFFDDWLICLDRMEANASDAECMSCSDEQDALFGCQ
jgi:hypothetical protein